MIYFQFDEIYWKQNSMEFWFVPEKYLERWVLISVNARFISYFRSSGQNVRCRIEFMMTSGNYLQSKCDHRKLYYLLGQSKHPLLGDTKSPGYRLNWGSVQLPQFLNQGAKTLKLFFFVCFVILKSIFVKQSSECKQRIPPRKILWNPISHHKSPWKQCHTNSY